jgi:glycosyltransferase involved in cell wall biosynthesis
VYNDWISLQQLLSGLETALPPAYSGHCHLLLVDDGSSEPAPTEWPAGFIVTLLQLTHNIGHQKAIAIGLSHAYHHLSFDRIIIMDSDGEDRPEDVTALLQAADKTGGVVVAKRVSRQEGPLFRWFYWLYKLMFYLLTGQRISFGNFMLLGRKEVDTLVHYSEIWNHLAGAVLKSRMPYTAITAHRGRRYAGQSKMNFNALLLHGLGAIGVFIERIASRLLIFSLALIFISILAIGVTMFIKIFTASAIPGWATTVVSSMLIVLLQSFLLSLFTIFLYLSAQGQRKFIPALHYMDYVRRIHQKKAGE